MIVLSEILNIFIPSRFFMLRVNTNFILEQFCKNKPFLENLNKYSNYYVFLSFFILSPGQVLNQSFKKN